MLELQGAQNKALALGKDPKIPQRSLEEELEVLLGSQALAEIIMAQLVCWAQHDLMCF